MVEQFIFRGVNMASQEINIASFLSLYIVVKIFLTLLVTASASATKYIVVFRIYGRRASCRG
jgi:hypothetical protein